eukprot:751095-Hanusia_phi.AAC.1
MKEYVEKDFLLELLFFFAKGGRSLGAGRAGRWSEDGVLVARVAECGGRGEDDSRTGGCWAAMFSLVEVSVCVPRSSWHISQVGIPSPSLATLMLCDGRSL